MQEPLENENKPLFSQAEENELKKIRLALEHGMDLSKSFSNSNMSPEIEGEFLDYIQQWEDQFASGKQVQVFEFIGSPLYLPLQDISAAQLPGELKRLQEIMQSHNVYLETLAEVDDRELYRFIIEELFLVEMNDIRIEGMMHTFIYEEFHPNHEYDIKARCREAVERMLNKDWDGDMITFDMTDETDYDGVVLSKEALHDKIMHFRAAFSAFDLHKLDLQSLTLNDENTSAQVAWHINYSGTVEDSDVSMHFSGVCTFALVYSQDWWHINALSIPGITI